MKRLGILAVVFISGVTGPTGSADIVGGEFELFKGSIGAGGGFSSAGDFSLTGTIGQTAVSPPSLSGGDFYLSSGSWLLPAPVSPEAPIFSDGFELL